MKTGNYEKYGNVRFDTRYRETQDGRQNRWKDGKTSGMHSRSA